MPGRTYGQYCGLARALEIVGERWALLVVRDLLVGPKRFTDLHRGLPGIPTNVLSARLRELEEAGVVQRRVLPRPSGSIVYELTERGQGLEDVAFSLGRWGAQILGDPRPDEIATANSLIMALHTTFQPEAAGGTHVAYELRFGQTVIHARIDNGVLETGEGPLSDADLVIEAGPTIRALMAREITPAQAIKNGSVRLIGKPKLLDRFVEMFHIGSMPAA